MSSAYQSMFIGQSTVLGAKEIWKVKAPGKCKFFLWLLVLDRCWTAEHRHRHGLHDLALYTLSAQEEE
jgi:fumarate reductase subunit D